jgi:DNA topoisomerase-3
LQQLDEITRHTDFHTCRMLHLVRHFGDQTDLGERCGLCDLCAPEESRVLRFREPLPDERAGVERILDALRKRNGPTSGQLHREVFGNSTSRQRHEELIGALLRSGLVAVQDDAFEKDGRVIEFKRVFLTPAGRDAPDLDGVRIPVDLEASIGPTATGKRKRRSTRGSTPDEDPDEVKAAASPALVEKLRAWRSDQARRKSVPAYCVFPDKVLYLVAAKRPRSADQLLALKGMGPSRVDQYGEDLLSLLAGEESEA